MKKVDTAPFGGKLWISTVLFGLVGQIAWVVENMYFATMAQDIFSNSGRQDLAYIVTTLMVIFSALTATLTTVIAGALCDRTGRRKPFIAFGYMAWGLSIMAFALIPMRAGQSVTAVAVALIALDCLMTLCGSTANDAAFQAWVADVTVPENRGRVNAVLSILPVIAVIIIFIGLGSLYSAENTSNAAFFLVLGSIVLVAGGFALLALRDAPHLQARERGDRTGELLYGFRPRVIRQHPMMYVCLSAACVVGIAQQTFFSYLMNFVIRTLGYGDGFVVPVAVIILGAALLTGAVGTLTDRWGKRGFYLPLLALVVAGTFSMYCLQFLKGTGVGIVLYVGGTVMMGAILSLTGTLQATFQDLIPVGCEGRFQGVRMCFTVLIPMIVGPLISLCIGLDAMGMNGADFAPTYQIFLAAALVAVPAALPLWLLRRREERRSI